MYLSKFQLLNYKSFRDSRILEFKPGINIIVGPNNSGKTALLEALSLTFQNHIHKSARTFPSPLNVTNTYSGCQISLIVKREDIGYFIQKLSESRLDNTADNTLIIVPPEVNKTGYISQYLNNFFRTENLKKEVEIEIRVRASANAIAFDSVHEFFSSSYNTPIEDLANKKELNQLNYQYEGFFGSDKIFNTQMGFFTQTIQYQFFQKYRNIIYKFNAERLNLGTSPAGGSCVLKSDASNLAEVIHNLQSNYHRFKRFNNYVSTVIPNIKWISTSLYDNHTIEIKVWNFDPETEREDLAYSLSNCGTGVSQVLAILYVVVTSQEPQTIIIDEPQSFLHPGAAKKLIEILKLKEFAEHQYFIATHSAEIIAAANPSTIVQLRYEQGETQASTMNVGDIREQRSLLAELGVSLSDVFGADSILWVEGPTEEVCFPLVLSKLAPEFLAGTKIISVKQTGDLLGKKEHFADVMFDLYRRLSGGNNLSPPVLGFVFDQENRDDQKMRDLQKRSSEPVYFLKRCMYENYLLHPDAIAAILNQCNLEQDYVLTSETVQKELEINKNILKEKKDAFPKNTTPEQRLSTQYIEENINAAKLLEMLFAKLPSTPIEFKKTTHSIMLTEWLLENDSDHLVDLVKFLQGILTGNKATLS